MGLPPSAKAHLNSLGIYRQLTVEDLTGGENTLLKSPGNEPQVEGEFAVAAWPGTYLHVGRNTTTSTSFYGTQADISVYNRSPGNQQYQGIGLRHAGDYRLGFQYCAQSPANEYKCYWVPAVHGFIDGEEVEWPYAQKTIYTTSTHSETHNLKLAVKSNGYIYPYVDHGLSVDPDHIEWNTGNGGAVQSAFELGSDSKDDPPHDPANHHSNVKVQTSINGTWYVLTNSISTVTMYNKVKQGSSEVADGLYNPYTWYINPNYNWMARPW